MKWITRARPKIDRIACPWLVARFIDTEPEFLYVPAGEVAREAQRTGATPYDVPDVELTHEGPLCSFDAFLKKFGLSEPALQRLALIVRAVTVRATDPLVLEDLTRQAEAARVLREHDERLRYTLGAAGVGTWEMDRYTGRMQWSETMRPLFGVDAKQLPATRDRIADMIHPDDRQAVASYLLRAIDDRAFVIALEAVELQAEFLRLRLQAGFDVGQRGRTVDVRLARAEQVQVGAVDDEDFAHSNCSWRTSLTGCGDPGIAL